MNAKAYHINTMSFCIGIYLNVYANKGSYDTWRGTSMLARKVGETLPRRHRRRVVLRAAQWNTGVATARASARQTARAKCVHQKRGLERSQSSFKRAVCQWVFSLEAVNHNCRPGSTEKRSLCFCSWACCSTLQISMWSMFLHCHCDCAMGDRFWEGMLVWCGSRPALDQL